MKLYGYWRSSCTWRVRIALHYKGLPFEYVPVHLLKEEQRLPAFLGKNPLGQVPVLDTEDGPLAQSLAIIGYLEERYPNRPLLPGSAWQRAKAWQLAEMMNAGIQPLHNLGVMNAVKERGADERVWAEYWISRGLLALEREASHTAGTYMVGDAVSLADACLVPQLYAARRFGASLDPYPTLKRVEAACQTLEPFVLAHADNQIDAVKT